MPFQSEKQRKYLWANEPAIAREWTDKYGSRVKKQDGGNTWFGGDPGAFFNKHAPYTMNLIGKTPVEKWINQPELIDLETRYGLGSAGLPSIARHTAGMSNLSDTFAKALAFNKNNPGGISQFFGDVGAFGAGALNEIPGMWRGLTGSAKDRAETWEDIKANALGTFKTPYGKTSEDIYKDVYAGKYTDLFDNQKGTIVPDKGIMKTNVLSNIWDAIKNEFGGSAEAAEMLNQTNPDKLSDEAWLAEADKRHLTASNPNVKKDFKYSTDKDEDDPYALTERLMRRGDFRPSSSYPSYPQYSKWNQFLSNVTRQPYRAATTGTGGYTAAQLNSMNALGGYYSEPMRQYRRDMGSIGNMWKRRAQGKKIGETRLKKLLNQYGGAQGLSDKDLSTIGQKTYTGPGQAFEKQASKGTFTTPSGTKGYYGGRAEGGLMTLWQR